MIRMTNNTLAVIIVVFTLVSIASNLWLYEQTSSVTITGRASQSVGTTSICVNHVPTMVADCQRKVYEGNTFFCDITYHDYDCKESCIFINATDGAIDAGQKSITGIRMKNFCQRAVDITNMTVIWTPTGGNIKRIRINGTDVWNSTSFTQPSGVQASGKPININDIGMAYENEYISIDNISFDSALAGKNITIKMFTQGTEFFSVKLVLGSVNVTRIYHNDSCIPKTTYSDYFSRFDIDPDTGEIFFIAPNNVDEIFTPIIGVNDNSGCSNSKANGTFIFNMSSNRPPIIISYHPNITTNPTYPRIRINETQSKHFNASYYDPEGLNVTARWYYDGEYITTDQNDTFSEYTRTTDYTSSGIHNITLNLTDDYNNSEYTSWLLNVSNVNRGPVLARNISDMAWDENTQYMAFDLDDYFNDSDVVIQDGDSLTYTYTFETQPHSIMISIDSSSHIVTFSQPRDWYGSEIVYFRATDSHSATARSNNVTLTVRHVPTTSTTITVSSSSGGGGGGGGAFTCLEEWYCTEWEPCNLNETRYRNCYDLNNCRTKRNMPPTQEGCEYIPECYDGLQNQNEDGIDCGGPCPPCGTCYDKIKNQGEYGIDCGGPCDPCPSCYDGILNNDEEDTDCGGSLCDPCPTCDDGIRNGDEDQIDCGGSCAPCKRIEAPSFIMSVNIRERLAILISLVSLLVLLFAALSTTVVRMYGTDIGQATRSLTSGFIGRISKKEERMISADETIKKTALKRISAIDSGIGKESAEKLSADLFDATKEFFGMALGITSEMTHAEIHAEVTKRKVNKDLASKIESYFDMIANIRYAKKEPTPSEIKMLSSMLKDIIHSSINPEKHIVLDENIDVRKVKDMIAIAKDLLSRGNPDNAAETYSKAEALYETLPEEEKARLYRDISSLYKKITSKK